MIREVRTGSGHAASSNSPILEFGLGYAMSATVTVTFPSDAQDPAMNTQTFVFDETELNRGILIFQGYARSAQPLRQLYP